MAEPGPGGGITREGVAARQRRANALKGSRQARLDLERRWAPAQKHDPAVPDVPRIDRT